jgi:hypothetical protein
VPENNKTEIRVGGITIPASDDTVFKGGAPTLSVSFSTFDKGDMIIGTNFIL